jgi:hypothetical protein
MTYRPKEKSLDAYVQRLWRKMGGWVFKVHGNQFTGSGIPDLVGCIPLKITEDMVGDTIGVFVAIEDKRSEKENASAIQLETIEKIKESFGYSKVVHTREEGKEALAEAGLVSKGSGRVCDREAVLRALYGAGDGKDLGELRSDRTTTKRRKRRVNRRPSSKR